MANEPPISEDANIEDVSLLNTDIAPPKDDAPAPAADEGKDDAAAAPDDAKTEQAPPVPDAKDNEAKAPDEAKDGDKPDEAKDQTEQQSDEPAADDADKTPQQLRDEQQARARMEYQNRQRTRQNVEKQLDENYAPKTEEQLLEEGMPPRDAQIEALRQEMNFREQRAQIAELNAGMQAEAVNVTSDFPVFNPKSPDFDEEFTKEVEQAYAIAARLQTDENGIVTNAEVPLYDFYQRMNGIYSRGTSKGNVQREQDVAQMVARTENPGGSSSTKGNSGDSLEELEERLGDVVIT